MGSAWLADAVLFVHVLFVLFVVGGFALILAGAGRWGWVHNRAFRIAHLAAIVFVAVETLLGFTCPLTLWEDVLRSTGRISTACTRPSTTARPGWVSDPIGVTPGGGAGRS